MAFFVFLKMTFEGPDLRGNITCWNDITSQTLKEKSASFFKPHIPKKYVSNWTSGLPMGNQNQTNRFRNYEREDQKIKMSQKRDHFKRRPVLKPSIFRCELFVSGRVQGCPRKLVTG